LNPLILARTHAETGRFDQFLSLCINVAGFSPDDPLVQLDVGVLLLTYGFLSQSQQCFLRAQTLAPSDLRAVVNLANVYRDRGEHTDALHLYDQLLHQLPDHPVIRRNMLTSLEYAPGVTDSERISAAIDWGKWAKQRAHVSPTEGHLAHMAQRPFNRPLRVGYVSADFCQHTVGLLIKDTLKAHDPTCVVPIAYHAGNVSDWVTEELRSSLLLRDVSGLDDALLARQIQQDAIDVLVDLSGHTAGSRLTVFAHRPAPVQVSWLGYFATTGLDTIDAVLLDDVHAPPGTESQFVEKIIRLPHTRWCYRPVPFAPEVAPLPADTRGYITFGSFNNTAKYHDGVHTLWAQVLAAVPDSRLILKWRTFNDEALKASVLAHYRALGISTDRIELRGPSFHEEVLRQYADVDIALDPFPFSGGLTSCEALWMGVPLVTWPQSRVVSRQTASFLSVIGMKELIAKDADHYLQIAAHLAADKDELRLIRQSMRARMQASPLMDLNGFTHSLEQALIDLYQAKL
jgi:predicted O-linked N-acetylglucosamine transferase (SPINDLY family)